MVDDMLSVARIEILEDWDDYGTIGDCTDKYSNPIGGVTTDKSDFVPFFHACQLKEKVDLGDVAGKLPVSSCFTFCVVG